MFLLMELFILLVNCIFLEYLEETYYFAFITCFIVLDFKYIGCLRYVWERIIIFFPAVIVHFTVLNFYCNIYISRRTLVRTLSLRYISMFCPIFSSLFYFLVRSLHETYCSTLKACITIINHVLNLSFYYIAYVCVNRIFYCMKL